jgi:hypothetical protein
MRARNAFQRGLSPMANELLTFRSGDQTRNPEALAYGISSANAGSEAT